MRSPLYKTGDIVQYNRAFWDYYEDPENVGWMAEVMDSPMIILKPTADKSYNCVKYTILQGDKKFSVWEGDLELIK